MEDSTHTDMVTLSRSTARALVGKYASGSMVSRASLEATSDYASDRNSHLDRVQPPAPTTGCLVALAWLAIALIAIGGVVQAAVRDEGSYLLMSLLFIVIPVGFVVIMGLYRSTKRASQRQQMARFFDDLIDYECHQWNAAKDLRSWQAANVAPESLPGGADPYAAEYWIRDWMEWYGAEDAIVTQQTNDGGIDVSARGHIAQVKHYAGNVGIGSIREFVGVVATDRDHRMGLFFTSGQYPRAAREIADASNVALFKYDVFNAQVVALNDAAEQVIARGLNSRWAK